MRLVKLSSPGGTAIFINPDYVIGLHNGTLPDGCPLVDMIMQSDHNGQGICSVIGTIEEVAKQLRGTSEKAEKVLQDVRYWYENYAEEEELCVEEEDLFASTKRWLDDE
jgi:hypothetical protein